MERHSLLVPQTASGQRNWPGRVARRTEAGPRGVASTIGVAFRGQEGPMRNAVQTGAGPERGCGALRSGRRRQERAARGRPVGAARSWLQDWLWHSRVRRLLGSGRAPRPRARRPLTTRYVLARRLRRAARAPRFRGRHWRQLCADSPGEQRRRRPGAGKSEHLSRLARRAW